MLVGGQQPGVLDTGTGRLAALPVPVARGDVAELDHAGGTTTALLHNATRLRSRAFAIGPSGKAVRLGRVLDLLPLRDGGVLTEDCVDAWSAGPCTLTGYGATGTIGWRRTVPGQLDLIRDTPYGLVVDAYQGDGGGLVRLEDARSGAVYRVIGGTCAVLGADDRQVVFVQAGCGSDSELTLADLDSGSSRSLPESPGTPAVAAFSGDGHRLAIGYAGMLPDESSASPQRDGSVVVVDLTRADRWQVVPNLTTGAASTALPVWSPDGRLLLAVPTDATGSGRVAAWRPGAGRITILPVGLTGFYGTPGLVAALT
jgi:hypothetical protein